jgi:speckle-type POZ protein
MFEIEMKEKKNGELIIEEIDINILRLMIKWIYTREIEVIELQDKMNLYKTAHRYQIESLKNWCIDRICKSIPFNNVLEIYAFAESYEEVQTQKKALEFMKERVKYFNLWP